jgi:predicted metalloprotease with PDZ domain
MPLSIAHRVSIPAPQTHLVEVETTLAGAPDEVVLFMPVWTPGSYLVREYARNVEGLTVDAPARATKIRKNAWHVEARGAERIVVRYRVYAGELTVRTSHVDETHAFLVGAALFLGVEGQLGAAARVRLEVPAGWRVATSLPLVDGSYVAADFDTLIDSPIEAGLHREARFDVQGTPHRYSIWPAEAVTDRNVADLVKDTTTILAKEAELFAGGFPYDAYELLLHLSPRGRGGLEHRASAALIASPTAFATREGYLDLLSLVAHEVFHAWNVKRIRPAGLAPYDYQHECYTRQLWWFEGATSYYDWRVLELTQLCTVEEYLEHLASEIAYVDATPGRLVHALEETSFDAWIKLYRPDENSPNSTVSYYRKGELVCAMLDLEIRHRSGGRASLDLALLELWLEHGVPERPVPEGAMQGVLERATSLSLGATFDAAIRSPAELDLAATFDLVGLTIERKSRTEGAACSLGVRLRTEGGRAVVASTTRDSCAARAGIDPGDELVGIAGARVEGGNVEPLLRGRLAGDAVDVLVARDGKLLTRQATLDPARPDKVKLVARKDATPAQREAFEAWLGRPHPAWSVAPESTDGSTESRS